MAMGTIWIFYLSYEKWVPREKDLINLAFKYGIVWLKQSVNMLWLVTQVGQVY